MSYSLVVVWHFSGKHLKYFNIYHNGPTTKLSTITQISIEFGFLNVMNQAHLIVKEKISDFTFDSFNYW